MEGGVGWWEEGGRVDFSCPDILYPDISLMDVLWVYEVGVGVY